MKLTTAIVSVLGFIGGVFGVTGANDASAGTANVPPRLSGNYDMVSKWKEISEGLTDKPAAPLLNPEIADVLAGIDLNNDLKEMMRLSYKLARPEEIEALDNLWLETMMSRGDSKLIAEYLSYRSTIFGDSLPSADALLDRWIWEADAGCDSAAGNPGNDKPVGNAGESPNGKDFGNGSRGRSQ